MVIILKQFGFKRYKIVKFSQFGNTENECRISDLLNPEICYDVINRLQLYRAIIDYLIIEGQAIRPYTLDEVTNTLHDRIVRYFLDLQIKIYLVEVGAQVYPVV
jgi:hypothetical protein